MATQSAPRVWGRLGRHHPPGLARATLKRVRAGLVVLNLLVAVILAVLLWRVWNAELHAARQQATAAATQLSQSAAATLGKVAVAVRYAAVQARAHLAAQGLDTPAFWAVMTAARSNVPELQRMGVFDADGHRLCNPDDASCRRYDIGDRDYFALLRQRPDLPPSVFGPFRARPGNELSLLVAQAIGTPAQPFAGVIVAVVPVGDLQPLVAAAKVGPQGIAGLRTERLELITRAADALPASASGPEAGITQALRSLVQTSPDAGSYRAVVGADQVDRVVSYVKVPGYPLYALVGLAVEDATASWRITAGWTAGLASLLLLASLAIERLVQASIERQAQAQALYDEAPCGYHVLDAQGRYVSVNATELAWLGCAREDVVGKLGPVDFVTEQGRAVFAACFPELQRTGRLEQLQLDLVGRHGETRRVVVTATAVFDAQGRFVQSNSVMHDITALHAAQLELAALAASQQAMLDTDLVGMVKVRAGLVTWTNRGMDCIFGHDGADWPGMPIARIFHDEAYYRQTAARIGALQVGGGTFREDQELRRKDGSSVWVDVSTVRLGPTGAESFTIAKDITDRKHGEAVRLRATELEAQNAALQESARLKDEFLANLSHELRTPLNAVTGFAHLLRTSPAVADQPKLAHYAQLIGDSSGHLLELVQTMLDFAKTAAGRMRFAAAEVDVATALHEVAEMLEPRRLEARVDLQLSVAQDLQSVVNDPLRLRQMLLNLAGNAVKFSRPGGTVRLEARALEADRWCVDVIDQGIGISASDLSRLFAPFVQLSSGHTKAYGGTGLGLALVRGIARAQGGDVEVRSELGVGSVFRLVLPRRLAAGAVAA